MVGFLILAGIAWLVWLVFGGYGLLILLAAVVVIGFAGWALGWGEESDLEGSESDNERLKEALANQKDEMRASDGMLQKEERSTPRTGLQPIVKGLMKTLLEDHPVLLSDTERSNLMDADYCKDGLGLTLSNLALLRDARDGRIINGYPRYWAKRYADRYYVCSEWWADHHCHNARVLRRFVDRLAKLHSLNSSARNLNDPDILALKRHGDALARFEQECRAVHQADEPREHSKEMDRLTLTHTFQIGGEAYYERGTLAPALPEIFPLAEQGHADAQFQLGLMYALGEGVPKDDVEAVKWLCMAAEQGHAGAQNNLGFMYALGRGVPEDDVEAMKWLHLAAEQGHAGAQNNLGGMYALGRGVREDDVEAVKWYRLAAEQGVVEAQYNLGRLTYAEDAWFTNDVEAHAWLNIAAAQGHKDAEESKEHLAKSMTPRRRRRAQKLAREYWERYVVPFRN